VEEENERELADELELTEDELAWCLELDEEVEKEISLASIPPGLRVTQAIRRPS